LIKCVTMKTLMSEPLQNLPTYWGTAVVLHRLHTGPPCK